MATSTHWQLEHESADRYQQILVPAILGPFARALVEQSDIDEGDVVLDVGCGTGAATRYAAERAGESGRVSGVDLNAGMVEVAKSISAARGDSIEWRVENANQLSLMEATVDVVLCAQTLQFLSPHKTALAEMCRVLKPGGCVAISIWCEIEKNPYFHALIDSITAHVGPRTAIGLKSIFGLSNADALHSLLADAGFEQISMAVKQLDLELGRLEEFIPRHISATPMAVGFNSASPKQRQNVIQQVSEHLNQYRSSKATCVPFTAYLVKANK